MEKAPRALPEVRPCSCLPAGCSCHPSQPAFSISWHYPGEPQWLVPVPLPGRIDRCWRCCHIWWCCCQALSCFSLGASSCACNSVGLDLIEAREHFYPPLSADARTSAGRAGDRHTPTACCWSIMAPACTNPRQQAVAAISPAGPRKS